MKKRGFTLIELLAVIVVLAIIALIATPIVMNVIKKASAGAAERSADNYVKAVETLIATEKLDGTPLVDGTYTIESDGTIKGNGETYTVEVSGTKPIGGTVVITNGQVVKADTTINYEDYTVKFVEGKATASEKSEALVLCKASVPVVQPLWNSGTTLVDTVVGVQATSDDPYTVGAVYKCNLGDQDRIFYVLKTTGDTVSLLMEENIGSTVKWCANSGDDNTCNGDGAINYLVSQTAGWTKLFGENGTVELPSYDDLTKVADYNWKNINLGDTFFSYWTSTADVNDSMQAYVVWPDGSIGPEHLGLAENCGVRPVITISKENMSL